MKKAGIDDHDMYTLTGLSIGRQELKHFPKVTRTPGEIMLAWNFKAPYTVKGTKAGFEIADADTCGRYPIKKEKWSLVR